MPVRSIRRSSPTGFTPLVRPAFFVMAAIFGASSGAAQGAIVSWTN